MTDEELTPCQVEALKLRFQEASELQLYALQRACLELRDALTRGEALEVGWWTDGRLNHAGILLDQVLRDRIAMGRRMEGAIVEAAGIQAGQAALIREPIGPDELPNDAATVAEDTRRVREALEASSAMRSMRSREEPPSPQP